MQKVFEENFEIEYLDLHLEQMKSFVMMEDLLTDQKKFDAARLVSLLYDVV